MAARAVARKAVSEKPVKRRIRSRNDPCCEGSVDSGEAAQRELANKQEDCIGLVVVLVVQVLLVVLARTRRRCGGVNKAALGAENPATPPEAPSAAAHNSKNLCRRDIIVLNSIFGFTV